MTETSIYMTTNYCGLSSLIYRLKNDVIKERMEKGKAEILLTAIITTMDTLSSNLAYRKVVKEINPLDDSRLTEFIGATMNNNLLETFFGENELSVMEMQLQALRQKLIATTEAVNFSWNRFFE